HLIALGLKDGKTVFDTKIAGDIISAPVVDGDSVYLTTFDGTVYRHRTSDGKVLWSKKMSGTSAPWIAAGEVHASEGKNVAGPGGPASGWSERPRARSKPTRPRAARNCGRFRLARRFASSRRWSGGACSWEPRKEP